MENHTDIETLLTKYFEGNTTPPENEQIEAWLNADEEHLRIAKQLNTLYLAVDTQHITKKIDTEKALDKVKSRIRPFYFYLHRLWSYLHNLWSYLRSLWS